MIEDTPNVDQQIDLIRGEQLGESFPSVITVTDCVDDGNGFVHAPVTVFVRLRRRMIGSRNSAVS